VDIKIKSWASRGCVTSIRIFGFAQVNLGGLVRLDELLAADEHAA